MLITHSKDKCKGQFCCIHNPSNHHMKDWPQNWRSDKGVMERICPHGVGHPDPDDLAYNRSIGRKDTGVHGCDGCCRPPKAKKKKHKCKLSKSCVCFMQATEPDEECPVHGGGEIHPRCDTCGRFVKKP